MATLDQILAGMIEFRNTVYSRLDTIEQKINDLELNNYNICTMCHGSGEIIPSYNLEGTPPGPITCPSCEGSGKVLAGNSVEKT
jgi:DnaJ-class molecular chaperone